MKHFEEISYKYGAAKITLSVKASNERAIAAYKKNRLANRQSNRQGNRDA
jgi:ribosomal protein S18 acetylase RimI-like enzyme